MVFASLKSEPPNANFWLRAWMGQFESAYGVPLHRNCIELESIVYSAVKGKSRVIVLGYCVPLSFIFTLIASPEGLLIL